MNKMEGGGLEPWLGQLASEVSCCSTKRNKIRLFFEGDDVFEAMVEDVGKAGRFIHVEMYMFLSDETGWRIANALMERARAGIPVCLVYDAIGSSEADEEMFDEMRNAGVNVEVFRPVAPWRKRSGILGRNHRKSLIVDGRVAYTGGMNLGNNWSRKISGSDVWRDTQLSIEGPGAAACDLFFRETWEKVGGCELDHHPQYQIDGDGPGEGDCHVVGGSGFSKRKAIRRLYSGAFSYAQEEVDLTVPYFVPPKRLMDAMREAECRGVEIEVLVPGRSDVGLADWFRECLYPSLMGDGLAFYEYQRSIMHAKSMVVDDRVAIVGSANFDFLSISLNWELAVVIDDLEVVSEVKGQYLRDLDDSKKVDAAVVQNRSWWRKWVGWIGVLLVRKL